MRAIAVSVFVLLASALHAQQRSHQASTTSIHNEDGKLQMTISYNPGCRCKVYTEYYRNGKVYAKKTTTLEGEKEIVEGEDVIYYPNGSIKEFKTWKQAVPEGRAYANYEDGKLEREEFYEGKYKSGTWRYYGKNGELIKELVFEKGKTPWNGKVNIAYEKRYTAGKLSYSGPTGNNKTPKAKAKTASAKQRTIAKPAAPANGKMLFQGHCSSCHAADRDTTGPALRGVTRTREHDWLRQMIKDGNLLLDLEDKQAQKLFRKWNGVRHPTFKKFTEAELDAIIGYLNNIE